MANRKLIANLDFVYTAKHRFADVAPRKMRPFADLVRGLYVDEALEQLQFFHNRSARQIEAVIKSAYANAQDQECPDIDELRVIECRIDGGPMFKRIRPRARGTAFGIKRRLSHIIVTLGVVPEQTEVLQDETPALPEPPAPTPEPESATTPTAG